MKQKQSKQKEWREVYGHEEDHARVLFRGIIFTILIFFATFFVSYYFSKEILDFILKGGKEIGYEFIYLSPIEIIAQQIKLSAMVGFIIILPLIITEILLYIMPAIDSPMGIIVKAFFFAMILFLLGAAFSYFILLPFSFQMFFEIGIETKITAQISVQKYIDLYLGIVVGLGFVFEIPLLAGLLSKLGLINSKMLIKGWYVSLIVSNLIAIIITPTTDLITELIVVIPIIGLYTLSIGVCRVIEVRKMKQVVSEG